MVLKPLNRFKKRMFVILNDNEMSIAPPTGALSSYLSRLYAGAPFQEIKQAAKGMVSLLPEPFQEGARRAKELLKGITVGGTLFEELGFSYLGPIDGHDMEQLLSVLRTVKARADGPIMIHAITKKGKGYAPAERADDKGHATAKFDVITGVQKKAPSNAPLTEPMPPMTVTMKDSMSMEKPMPGDMERTGAARPPASPANKPPKANTEA